ncbi:beta-L-arabinofuranosidase domain-containing protein [Curtobacterium sp. MCBD17_040]|uniref:glycoside hydrolase family 127 protein n=1 Tax=Curtobacterium sp. MCBD17_040 TaxID=2175674 RepID=UPI000DA9FFDA|nr:beta-L-arabinofuranosidase domain-containing protein [Curtobacterium sp. MCBD17_040]WIB65264.1 glycoside hydrolase family 127 protein [Curtobacterium sp. MCBD17_040]
MPVQHLQRESLSIDRVTITDDFWAPRRAIIRERTIPHQQQQLRSGGQFESLRLTWRPGDPGEPHVFWESDVAKWIEAASYVLTRERDPELERGVDEAIELLRNAQQPDGYLNVYFTLVKPGQRFTDLRDAHELYCAGHLVEAAVAHHAATGKTSLLDIVRRYVDLIDRETGPGGAAEGGYDGHEEIELALVKLYRSTGERRYLELSERLINNRGTEPYFFDSERDRRGNEGWAGDHAAFRARPQLPELFREYSQAHRPVREQRSVVGHAVRAMYLYSAMADLARELEDQELREACEYLWDDLVSKKLYITGGLGSDRTLESFGNAYDLPDKDAYAETCAAIGLVFWAHRMALLTGDAKYVDVLERALYNGVLSGLSSDGTCFFYGNPLASESGLERSAWFGTACCPPNLARLLSSLEQYVYVREAESLAVHLYVAGTADFDVDGHPVTVRQTTSYPWDGRVTLAVTTVEDVEFTLKLRVPDWAGTLDELLVNGEVVPVRSDHGYAVVRRSWHDGDSVVIDLPLEPRRVRAQQRVGSALGKVALQRGPIVHCVEEVDNGGVVTGLGLDRSSALLVERSTELQVDQIVGDGVFEALPTGDLYTTLEPAVRPARIRAVPYFAWANRARGSMAVWIRESAG